MHSVNATTAKFKRIFLLTATLFIYTLATAQENSPYSRYGLGDLIPNRNIISRSMGGISTGLGDISTGLVNIQSINLSNPAGLTALGFQGYTHFDIGGEVDVRTLKSNTTPQRYTGTNTLISYLQLAFPLTTAKMRAKNNYWIAGFGLKPITRINYKIQENKRLSGIDSLATQYEGNGGLNQVNVSTAYAFKNFSIGVSGGYSFGNKDYSTRLTFLNDTIAYASSTSESRTRFGGLFINVGAQYKMVLTRQKDKPEILTFGASANLQQNLAAKRDVLNATVTYNSAGEISHIDTVTSSADVKGTVKVPAAYSFGFTYLNNNWLFGADIDYTAWSGYSAYGQKDAVINNVTFRAGAQYSPVKPNTPITRYRSLVKYRAGFYYGNDYVKLNSNRPDYALTLGAGLPLTTLYGYRDQYVILNTGVELGQRGTKQNQSLREGFARVMIGVSIDARWFVKRKYD